MLKDGNAMATIAVKDLNVARKFYEGQLGLQPTGAEEPGMVTYQSANSVIMVYESQYAGTNKATAATWTVGDDIENLVQALKARGVLFEHYDWPDTTRQGDIHVSGAITGAVVNLNCGAVVD